MDFEGYKRGVNLGGWLSQCNHQKEHYDSFITDNDIKRIATWGVDHVRLPIDYELIQAEDGSFKPEGFQYIDSCIRWCKENRLNMILDLHKTAGYSFDESESSIGFFYDKHLQHRFLDLWEELARRYGEYDDYVSFELLNEVVDVKVADIWNDLAHKAVKVIRQHAKYTYILLGGVCNNAISSLKLLPKPFDEYMVYTFHYYEAIIFTHQSAYWIREMSATFSISYPGDLKELQASTKEYLPADNSKIYSEIDLDKIKTMGPKFFEAAFTEAIEIAKKLNVSLYCGEYGVIDKADLQSTLNWYKDINSVFEKYDISRAAWNYKGKDFGISDPHYADIQNQLVRFL